MYYPGIGRNRSTHCLERWSEALRTEKYERNPILALTLTKYSPLHFAKRTQIRLTRVCNQTNIFLDYRIKTGKRIDIMLVSDFCAHPSSIVAQGKASVLMLEINGLGVC
jgi:hypothetical protein